jgi:hypothetical protein
LVLWPKAFAATLVGDFGVVHHGCCPRLALASQSELRGQGVVGEGLLTSSEFEKFGIMLRGTGGSVRI